MLPFILTVLALSKAQASPAESLCTSGETVIFSCSTAKGKVISLCASADLSKTTGWLQYRFGTPKKIELEYPETKERSAQSFKYVHYFRAQVDQTHINFKNGKTSYSVFDEYDGESAPAVREAGVNVMPGNLTVRCKGPVNAHFSGLADVLACDPDDHIGLGCP
jgi:hypothetical protein